MGGKRKPGRRAPDPWGDLQPDRLPADDDVPLTGSDGFAGDDVRPLDTDEDPPKRMSEFDVPV